MSKTSKKSKWEDNSVQFPRLISEIMATQKLDIDALCHSMDIDGTELLELFDRALEEWERVKIL